MPPQHCLSIRRALITHVVPVLCVSAVVVGGAGAATSLAMELAVASALPDVHTRAWLATSGATVKLLPIYSYFRAAVLSALVAPSESRLYWFPTDACVISERKSIKDDDSLKAYHHEYASGRRPIVWAYWPAAADHPASPEAPPALLQPTSPAPRSARCNEP